MDVRQRAQRDMISVENVRDQLAQHQLFKTGAFLEILVIIIKQLINGHPSSSNEPVQVLSFNGPQYVCWVVPHMSIVSLLLLLVHRASCNCGKTTTRNACLVLIGATHVPCNMDFPRVLSMYTNYILQGTTAEHVYILQRVSCISVESAVEHHHHQTSVRVCVCRHGFCRQQSKSLSKKSALMIPRVSCCGINPDAMVGHAQCVS